MVQKPKLEKTNQIEQKTEKTKKEHFPRLNTILMVEDTLKNTNESLLTIAQLKRELPKKINHNTLMMIIDYLDKSNKIAFSAKGMTWIHNPDFDLKKALREGTEH